MTPLEFLGQVLPSKGVYCTVNISDKKRVSTRFVDTIEDVITVSNKIANSKDAYFALASFKEPTNRSASNAAYMRSFFVDVDCGQNKPYEDQIAGMRALRTFTKAVGLPKPTIVNSGRGLHAYWPIAEDIPATQWLPYAERLVQLCEEHKFNIDTSVTADRARILRVPDTLNHKGNPALPVRVITQGEAYEWSFYAELLQPAEDPLSILDAESVARIQGKSVQVDTLQLQDNFKASFKQILQKSLAGKGCAQILYAFENQATLEEPLWRAMLSIANVCEDREKAIHIMSREYPGYDREAALLKAAATKGPYTCETFKKLNPMACPACDCGQIKSPVVLGRKLIEATETELVSETDDLGNEATFEIPTYPEPFARGKHGGVYHIKKDEDGLVDQELVYPYDLYVVRRIHDIEQGEVVLLRLHLPKDGVREFSMPLAMVLAQDKLRDKLASQGITVIGNRQKLLMVYIARWVEELQTKEAAQESRRQFGWTKGYKSFIVGDREVFADRVEYSPPSSVTAPIVQHFGEAGDLEVWKDVVNYYAHPTLANKAFAIFLGFGNILLEFTNVRGFWYSMYSTESGAGKSTLAYAMASIYGHPKDTTMRASDTGNAFWNRTGVHKNIPVVLDEITEMHPKASSSMLYTITEGREKERMQAHVNAVRENTSRWHTGVVSTSNQSVRSKLIKSKLLAIAEAMRMLECYIPGDKLMSEAQAGPHFSRLDSNFGVAAVPYLQHVIKNLPLIRERMDQLRLELAKSLQVTGPERFWLAMGTIAIMGGRLANEAGVINIPVKPVARFFMELVNRSRLRNENMMSDAEDFLVMFIQSNIRAMLVINNDSGVTDITSFPDREPTSTLAIRYEPDTKMLYVASKAYQDACSEYSYDMDASLAPYKLAEAYLGVTRFNLAKGSIYDAQLKSSVLKFDVSKIPSFDEEAIIKATEEDTV